jgi:hypothetical protein
MLRDGCCEGDYAAMRFEREARLMMLMPVVVTILGLVLALLGPRLIHSIQSGTP